MKIIAVDIWKIPLAAKQVYYMAGGKTCDVVPTVIVRIQTDTPEIFGFGECCPIPHYLPAYADGVVAGICELAPVLLHADPRGVDALMTKANAHLIGHPPVKSAVNIALWDIMGKVARRPLYELLGGKQTEHLPLYHSISCLPPDEMAQIAADSYANGTRYFQAKLGVDSDWQMDVRRMLAVREAVGDAPLVYGDWNCGASSLDAIRVGRAVAQQAGGDFMLEQPCATLDACARVKSATGLAMKMDENAHDTASLLTAYRLGCMDAVALKLSKFGGISAIVQARNLCCELGGIGLCIEDTWGSDIATLAALHVATATPTTTLLNVCDLSNYVTPRIDATAPVREGGFIRLPSEDKITAGLGVNPDSAQLDKLNLLPNPIHLT